MNVIFRLIRSLMCLQSLSVLKCINIHELYDDAVCGVQSKPGQMKDSPSLSLNFLMATTSFVSCSTETQLDLFHVFVLQIYVRYYPHDKEYFTCTLPVNAS